MYLKVKNLIQTSFKWKLLFLYLFFKGPIFSLCFWSYAFWPRIRELIIGCISALRLRTPPLIRTEKELSDKVQLLEVRYVWIRKY